MSQSAEILAYLQTGNSLTPLQAFRKFGCLRLAARILEIKAAGNLIVTERLRAGGKSVARYWLVRQVRRRGG